MRQLAQRSIRQLVRELEEVEEAVRRCPTYNGETVGDSPLNPELVRLLAREEDLLTRLRQGVGAAKVPSP